MQRVPENLIKKNPPLILNFLPLINTLWIIRCSILVYVRLLKFYRLIDFFFFLNSKVLQAHYLELKKTPTKQKLKSWTSLDDDSFLFPKAP